MYSMALEVSRGVFKPPILLSRRFPARTASVGFFKTRSRYHIEFVASYIQEPFAYRLIKPLWEARLAAIMFRMNGISQRAHGCAMRLFQFCTAHQLCGAIMHRMCCISQRAHGCAVRLFTICTMLENRRETRLPQGFRTSASHRGFVQAPPTGVSYKQL